MSYDTHRIHAHTRPTYNLKLTTAANLALHETAENTSQKCEQTHARVAYKPENPAKYNYEIICLSIMFVLYGGCDYTKDMNVQTYAFALTHVGRESESMEFVAVVGSLNKTFD